MAKLAAKFTMPASIRQVLYEIHRSCGETSHPDGDVFEADSVYTSKSQSKHCWYSPSKSSQNGIGWPWGWGARSLESGSNPLRLLVAGPIALAAFLIIVHPLYQLDRSVVWHISLLSRREKASRGGL